MNRPLNQLKPNTLHPADAQRLINGKLNIWDIPFVPVEVGDVMIFEDSSGCGPLIKYEVVQVHPKNSMATHLRPVGVIPGDDLLDQRNKFLKSFVERHGDDPAF